MCGLSGELRWFWSDLHSVLRISIKGAVRALLSGQQCESMTGLQVDKKSHFGASEARIPDGDSIDLLFPVELECVAMCSERLQYFADLANVRGIGIFGRNVAVLCQAST